MCAYAPGVVDRSGEIRAAGKMAMGAGIAQGIEGGYKVYQENTLRNKALQGANNALLAQFMNDPDAKKYAPEGLDKFIEKSIKGGGLSLNDNVQLNGLLNTTIATKNAIMSQQEKAQEQELRKQQMEQNVLQMQEAKRKAAMQEEQQSQLQKLKQFANLSQTNGVLRADVQDGMQDRINKNPFLAAQVQAMQAGAPMAQDTLAQFVTQNQKLGAGIDFEKLRIDDPKTGKTMEVAIDKRTGKEVGRGTIQQPPKVILTPDEQVDVATRTEEGKHKMKAAVDFVSSVASGAEAAQSALPSIQAIEQLYANGAKSGFGQDFLTAGGALALRMGIGDAKTQADNEQLQKLLTSTALSTAKDMKGEGTISNFEREMIAKASADVGKSPEANLRIIRLARAAHERQIDMELMRQNYEDAGLSTAQIKAKLERWRTQNPLEGYVKQVKDDAATAKTAAPKLPEGWKFTP